MTSEQLVTTCLKFIFSKWYTKRPDNFFRDKQHLIKAILRYAKVCEQRGWEPEVHEICSDIIGVLRKVTLPEKAWLPLYLEGAVDRHVRLQAETLAEKSKGLKTIAETLRSTLAAAPTRPVQTSNHIEQLAGLYDTINRKLKKQKSNSEQLALI